MIIKRVMYMVILAKVIIEIRDGGEVVIRSRVDPVRFIDELCSSNNKLGKRIDVKKLIEEE
jgi:hypothetical protein